MSKRVLIAGYYGHGNTGDEAILTSLLDDLRSLDANLDFTVLSHSPGTTEALHSVDAVHDADLAGVVDAAQRSDLVLLGGGGLFQDYWETRREDLLTENQAGMLFYFSVPVLAALLHKPCMIYGVGVGPLTTPWGRDQMRLAFRLAQGATVRDSESLDLIRDIDPDAAKQVLVTADPAVNLERADAEEVDAFLTRHDVEPGTSIVGCCLRFWDFGVDSAGWEREVAQALDHLVAESNSTVVFLPFQKKKGATYEDDLAVSQRVRQLMTRGEKTRWLPNVTSPALVAGVLARCRLVLAMRFHAVLFSLVAGTPVVAMAYDPKVTSLMKQFSLRRFNLPPTAWKADTLLSCLTEAIQFPIATLRRSPAADLSTRARSNATLALDLLHAQIEPSDAGESFLRQLALDKSVQVLTLQRQLRQSLEGKGRARVTLEKERELWRSEHERACAQAHYLESQLVDIHGSLAFRITRALQKVFSRLIPQNSHRHKAYQLLRRPASALFARRETVSDPSLSPPSPQAPPQPPAPKSPSP